MMEESSSIASGLMAQKYCTEIITQNKTSLENSRTALSTLEKKDLIISSLKASLLQYEELEQFSKINFELDEDDEKEQLVEENEELKEQINFLQQNTEKMSGTIILKEAQIKELGKELKTLKEKNANTESKMRKMFATEEILIKQLEVEKFKGQKM
ncbi:inositol 1,4,5-triphosphate receptor associated 2-like, partial [Heptranchias perlo]|uniref:inositol 1,4,5-triphosphate receptor associated 2-like n=1 Tax=Heptranchias perlo TaxID=212740 RepID=UPI00355A82FD